MTIGMLLRAEAKEDGSPVKLLSCPFPMGDLVSKLPVNALLVVTDFHLSFSPRGLRIEEYHVISAHGHGWIRGGNDCGFTVELW
jgi:hypothetical protein